MKSAKFKDSPLGPIPQDWEVKRLGDVWVRFSTGPFGSALHASDYVEDGTPVVNPMHILDGKIVPSKDMRINDETLNRLSSYRLRKNDIILGRRGEMGRAALVTAKEDGWLCGTGSFSITLDSSVSPDYIALYIRTPNCIAAMENGAIGTTILNLNQVIVSNIPIALPPLPEQQRIAEALGEVDKLIESLDEQIEKKRLIAKGVAHDLLSAKKRLPGFEPAGGCMQDRGYDSSLPEGWAMKRLGDCVEINPIGGQIPDEFVYVDLESVKNGCLVQNNVVLRRDAPSRAQRQFAFGDVLFQTVRPYQKNNLFVNFNASKYVASTGYAVLRERDGVSAALYIYAYLHLDSFVAQVLDKCTGTSYPAINPTALAGIEIALPELAEQQAIADLLSEQDAAIAALEAKREKYARIKEGMMRDLLTGKVRMKGE